MKNINDEALKDGENVMVTIKKLGKALDKGREMSIQEAIYRALGLKMTRFKDVVRFIGTSHPERREGLLKPNLDELDEDEKNFKVPFMISTRSDPKMKMMMMKIMSGKSNILLILWQTSILHTKKNQM